ADERQGRVDGPARQGALRRQPATRAVRPLGAGQPDRRDLRRAHPRRRRRREGGHLRDHRGTDRAGPGRPGHLLATRRARAPVRPRICRVRRANRRRGHRRRHHARIARRARGRCGVIAPTLAERDAPAAEKPAWTWSWTSVLVRRELLLVAVMVVIVVLSTMHRSYFWSSRNISFILADSMVITFLALGQTFALLSRGIDLSVAPIMGLSAVIVGFRAQDHGMTLLPAVFLGALVGLVLGLGNALLVGIVRLPPIIAT